MLAAALGFVVGVWLLQQFPVLPSVYFLLIPLGFVLLLWRCPCARRAYVYAIFALMLGIAYASLRAEWRLQDSLDARWQGRPISIIGVVASLPQYQTDAIRFEFDVERTLTTGVKVPSHIALTQYLQSQFSPQSHITPLAIHAGQRWQLSVKLKRPHGVLNPFGRDTEAWAIAHNIGANGSLLNVTQKRLKDFVWRPSYMVHACRERIAHRMQQVLPQQPYLDVLKALSIGDDSGIEGEDWQVFLNTGVNHLMSISGLHITMLAAFAAWLTWHIWRRSPRLLLRFPARKASAISGALVALAYAFLAGFSVPSQRTVYMLLCFALAMLYGRQISLTRILIYALLVVVVFDPWAPISPGFWLSFGAVGLFMR
jgi:competence protein ComEC